MAKFHSDRQPSGRRESNRDGGRQAWQRDFGGRTDARPTMHSATCNNCGRDCQVPFRPNGKKPVFCPECFKKDFGGSAKRFAPGGDFAARPSFGDKKMFAAVCDTCGKSCEVPFKPTGEKPVYCRDCFGGKAKSARPAFTSAAAPSNDILVARMSAIEAKVDQILDILNSAVIQEEIEETPEEPVAEPEKKAKPSTKKPRKSLKK